MASLAFLIVVGPGMFLLGMVTDWAWYLRAAIVVVAGIGTDARRGDNSGVTLRLQVTQ